MNEIGIGVWITAGIVVLLICYLTIWVTNKAYSKKWEDED
jgi:hypothetical protein